MILTKDVLELALLQDGDAYIFGHEVSPDDENPSAFDCSELVEWVCARLGVNPTMPDGSWLQARHCKNWGAMRNVEDGIRIPGALLFKFSSTPFEGPRPSSSHVAISQGNGLTIEARGRNYGTGIFDAHGRGWTHAALIPGVYQTPARTFADAWEQAYDAGLLSIHSNPTEVVTTQRLMAFLARANVT